MTKESGAGGGASLSRTLPSAAGLAMLVVYLLTLHPWVSPENLRVVGDATGLNWRIDLLGPVTWLVTAPIRLLPAAWIPVALNLTAALCAAACLALLARLALLIPRIVEETKGSSLELRKPLPPIRFPWLPPVLAVLVCGWQLSFWEHAILGSGEMFQLLLFAGVAGCLFELRLRRRVSWLFGGLALYGAAVANNWAMAAYVPLFVPACAWAARVQFLSGHFPERVRQHLKSFGIRYLALAAVCFLAGLSLVVLLPATQGMPELGAAGVWGAVRVVLRAYQHSLLGMPPPGALMVSLVVLLPLLFLVLASGEAVGNSRLKMAGGSMFRLMHLLFLGMGLWTALDFPLSPRAQGVAFPCLPLYWLNALGVGYFVGFCLRFTLVCPRQALRHLPPTQRRLQLALAWAGRVVQRSLAVAPWIVLAVAPLALAGKNLPGVWQERRGAFESYSAQLARSLPPAGAVLLSADPFRLACLETVLLREGRLREYLPIDTTILSREPAYFEFLRQRYPKVPLAMPASRTPAELTNAMVFVELVQALSSNRPVLFLHPVYGLLGEYFAPEPRGLLWALRPLARNAVETAPLSPETMAGNRAFWSGVPRSELSKLAEVRRAAAPPETQEAWKRFFMAAQVRVEPDRWAGLAGASFSGALNGWGVALQKAGCLAEAGGCFEQACRLNPDNAAARINAEFNRRCQSKLPALLRSESEVAGWLGKRRSWEQVLGVDGPVDEPNVCCRLGGQFAEIPLHLQAVREFQRAQTLAPAFPNAAVGLSGQFLWMGDYSNCLAAASRALEIDPASPLALYHKGYALFMLKRADQAIPPLTECVSLQKTNHDALMLRALAFLECGQVDSARRDYENAAALMPDPTPAFFSLIELAHRLNDANAALKFGGLYLARSPTNQADVKKVRDYMARLRAKNPK